MKRPSNIVAILLTHVIRYLIKVLVLDVKNYHGFLFLCCEFIIIFSFGDTLLSFKNIHKRAFDDLNDGLIQLESLFELDFD
jgi:hypothetical protein